jgi:hypothetical protein
LNNPYLDRQAEAEAEDLRTNGRYSNLEQSLYKPDILAEVQNAPGVLEAPVQGHMSEAPVCQEYLAPN